MNTNDTTNGTESPTAMTLESIRALLSGASKVDDKVNAPKTVEPVLPQTAGALLWRAKELGVLLPITGEVTDDDIASAMLARDAFVAGGGKPWAEKTLVANARFSAAARELTEAGVSSNKARSAKRSFDKREGAGAFIKALGVGIVDLTTGANEVPPVIEAPVRPAQSVAAPSPATIVQDDPIVVLAKMFSEGRLSEVAFMTAVKALGAK